MWDIIGNRGFLMMLVLVYVAMVWLWTEDGGMRSLTSPTTEERLRAYAALSNGGPVFREPAPKEVHQILLGTLKKVELKNSVLLTVLIFLEAAAFGAWGVSQFKYPSSPEVAALLLAAFALFPSLLAGLRGIRQLDTFDLRGRGTLSQFELQRVLRGDMMQDLEKKERLFRFASYSTKLTLSFLFIYLATRILLSATP